MAAGGASAADLPAFCTTRVVPKATTLTPSTPMAAHSHLSEWPEAAPATPACDVADKGWDDDETIRLMIFLRKIQRYQHNAGRVAAEYLRVPENRT
jgi:predicted cobalt transporter CbtA